MKTEIRFHMELHHGHKIKIFFSGTRKKNKKKKKKKKKPNSLESSYHVSSTGKFVQSIFDFIFKITFFTRRSNLLSCTFMFLKALVSKSV